MGLGFRIQGCCGFMVHRFLSLFAAFWFRGLGLFVVMALYGHNGSGV